MIKIISGKYKGLLLKSPKGKIIRPTSSYKKEAIFNILTSRFIKLNKNSSFKNKVILDAFAGTGNLGLEALSRGAKYCYFIEKNIAVCKILEKNCASISNDNIMILNHDYDKFINTALKKTIDIVFFDPPYNYNINEKMFTVLLDKINKSTIFVVETNYKTIIPEIKFFKIIEERIYGKTKINILTFK